MTDRPDLILPIEALVRWLHEQDASEALFIIKSGDSIRVASTRGTKDSIKFLAEAALQVVNHAKTDET